MKKFISTIKKAVAEAIEVANSSNCQTINPMAYYYVNYLFIH